MEPVRTGKRRIGKALLLVALLAIVVLGAALGVPLLQQAEDPEPAKRQDAAPSEETSAEPTASTTPDIFDEADFLAERIGGQTWQPMLESVRVTSVLRRPVIEVVTGIEGEDPTSAEALAAQLYAFALPLETPAGTPPTFCIQVLSAEGELLATTLSTDDRWQLDVPPAPTDAASLRSWLDTVYRTSAETPEPWVVHVLEVRDPSADPDGYVVIGTDLDPEHEGDLVLAQQIVWAVNSSGATFAPGIRVRFADPSFEWTALLDGRDPFAP